MAHREFSPTFSYQDICDGLTRFFADKPKNLVRLTGILFARPTSPLSRSEIIHNLSYFHCRSGKHVDFYLVGYQEGSPDEGTDQVVVTDTTHGWVFSESHFATFCREIEALTTWHYSGGVDLILTNAKYDETTAKAYLDFSSSIGMNLDRAKHDGLVLSVETFFEEIFRYAETQSGVDPTWGFSDQSGMKLAGSALKNLLLSLLPKSIRGDAKGAFHLTVADISL